MPATVDSAAIAGMIDLLRVQGCFALSVRYAVCFELGGGPDFKFRYPTMTEYESIGKIFEKELNAFVADMGVQTLEVISASDEMRKNLCKSVRDALKPIILEESTPGGPKSAMSCLEHFVTLDEEGGNLDQFVNATVAAFFDNDLLHTVRIFLKNAKGSFGLCVTTSLDAHRQVAMAAKGQTLCIAFYPRKGVICYGSEQAAVKVSVVFVVVECTMLKSCGQFLLKLMLSCALALAFVICRLGSIMRRPKANPIGARTLSLWMKTRSVLILTIWGESFMIYVLRGLLFRLVFTQC